MKIVYFLLIFSSFIIEGAFCQGTHRDCNFERFNLDKVGDIYNIYSDYRGYIYLASSRGLFRFNGQSAVRLCPSGVVKSEEYIGFYRLDNRAVLALPFNGQILKLTSNRPDTPIYLFKSIRNLTIYYAHRIDSTIYFCTSKSKLFEEIILYDLRTQSCKIDSTMSIIRFFKKSIRSRYLRLAPQSLRDTVFLFKELEQANYTDLDWANDSLLTIGSKSYVIPVKHNAPLLNLFDFGKIGKIKKMQYSLDGKLLFFCIIGRDCGAYLLDRGKLTCLLKEESVTGILEDVYHNIWISTLTNGLHKISEINRFSNSHNWQHNPIKVQNIYTFGKFHYYIADYFGNLFQDSAGVLSKRIRTTNKEVIKTSLHSSYDDHFVFVNHDRCFKFDRFGKKIGEHSANKFQRNMLGWISYGQDDIFIADRFIDIVHKSRSRRLIVDSKLYNFIFCPDSLIYLGSLNGINVFDHHKKLVRKFYTGTAIDSQKILGFCMTKEKLLVVGESEILQKDFHTGATRLVNSNTLGELPHQMIAHGIQLIGIVENGFVIYDSTWQKLVQYSLPDWEHNKKVLCATLYESTLTLCTKFGIKQFDLGQIQLQNANSSLKKVYISKIIDNGNYCKVVSDTSIIVTFSKGTKIQLVLDLFNFGESSTEQLCYRSEGDEQPVTITNNIVEFDNTYKSINTLEIFDKQKKVATIICIIVPLWYQTKWFLAALGLVLLMLVIFVFKFVKDAYIRKEKNRFDQRIKYIELEGLTRLNQLKPHFVFNALMPLQNYILNRNVSAGLDYLAKFSTLLRKMLPMGKEEVFTLFDEVEFLENYISLRHEELSKNFVYSIVNNVCGNPTIPSLLVQPIVENAINYGMDSAMRPRELLVTISQHASTLEFVIFDSGNGISQNLASKLTEEHALNIIETRLNFYKVKYHNDGLGLSFFQSSRGFSVIIIVPILNIDTNGN